MQESHGKIKLNFSYYMGLKCCLNNFDLVINKIVYEVYEKISWILTCQIFIKYNFFNCAPFWFCSTINFNQPIYIKFKMKKDSALGS